MQSASYLTEHLNWILTPWYISILQNYLVINIINPLTPRSDLRNFSQVYPYIIQQTGNEIIQIYQLEIVIMM